MSNPRTPAQMAEDVNNLNCHARGGGYGPVTPTQMEAIYREARKMEWTDKKPDRPGWWCHRIHEDAMPSVQMICGHPSALFVRFGGSVDNVKGQWSTRPIEMPEEKK